MKTGKLYTSDFRKNIRRKLVAGLLVVFPIFITFIIIKFLFGLIGGILSPVVEKAFILLGSSPKGTVDDFVVTSIAFILTFSTLFYRGYSYQFLWKIDLKFL